MICDFSQIIPYLFWILHKEKLVRKVYTLIEDVQKVR